METSIQIFMILTTARRVLTNIEKAPQITSQFQTEYYIVVGNEKALDLGCEATGQSPIMYEWRHNGTKVVPSQYVTVDENTGRLSIIHSQFVDFGKYQCFAKNALGTAVAAEFDVKRGFIEEFSDKQLVQYQTTAYKYMNIPCAGKPKCEPRQDCKIEWKRGTGTKDTITESKRVAVDANGDLHFLYAEVGDESTPAVPIKCGMNNEPFKAFYKGRDVIFRVAPATNPNQFKPFLVFAQDVKGLFGWEATLQCVFAGYPVPDIEWYRSDGSLIIVDGVKYSFVDDQIRRDLIIKNLTQNDEEQYRCDANNIAGKGSSNVFLNVTSKPRFSSSEGRLESKVVPAGHDAKFTCKLESLEGERRPTAPEWSTNGVLIRESQRSKYQLNADHTELTIKNVAKGDSCSIMCESGNVIFDDNLKEKFVKTYAGETLSIIDPIKITVLTPQHIEIDDTTSFSMGFTATTDPNIPTLVYNWTFTRPDNVTTVTVEETSAKPWIIFFNNKNNLTIVTEKVNKNSLDDKVGEVVGIYRVNIYHQYESVTLEFLVTTNTEVATKAPIVESAGFDLWIICLILGVIVLLIVVFFIICTLYRNRGGEYPVDKKEVAAGHDPEKELKDGGFADLSRANGERTTYDKVSLTDDVKPLESDEDSMMGDYDDDADIAKFNEDGSFIGVYMDRKSQDQSSKHEPTHSTV